MSHFLVLIAVTPDEERKHGGIQEAVTWNLEPFSEGGEWFADGSRWDWWVIGGRYSGRLLGSDTVQRLSLTESALLQDNIRRANEIWDAWLKEKTKDDFTRGYLYGFEPEDTRESVIERYSKSYLTACAFVSDRKWREAQRVGWFGGTAATECERKADEQGIDYSGRCIHTCQETGAKIVTFADEHEDRWNEMYWPRFVRPLQEDTWLIAVDCHV